MASLVMESMLAALSKSPLRNIRSLVHGGRCVQRGCSSPVLPVSYLPGNRSSSTSIPQQQRAGEATEPAPRDREQESLQHEDYFDLRPLVTLSDLFTARVHLGHKVGCRNAYMTPYLFGCRQGVDILDLDQTLERLQDAMNVTAHIAYRGGIILFISRNSQMMPVVEKTAEDCGEFSHCRYWKGGTFTNATVQFQCETRLPDLCIFISTQNNVFQSHRALTESAKLLIPCVGVVDSNCDPRLVTYPVPGNDDSPAAVSLYCRLFKEAIMRGKAKRKEDGLEAA